MEKAPAPLLVPRPAIQVAKRAQKAAKSTDPCPVRFARSDEKECPVTWHG
jgi:hypothetical protein